MVSKELRRLSRRELVDIIYQLKKDEQELRDKITAMEESLMDKEIRISVAGSIAEAATDITQIFSVAQRTADLYLREITAMKEDTEKQCAAMVEDAKKQTEKILSDGEGQLANLRACYQDEQERYQHLMAEIQRLEEKRRKD